jgi:hypothetical protein
MVPADVPTNDPLAESGLWAPLGGRPPDFFAASAMPSDAGPVLDAISTVAMSALMDRSGETSFILLSNSQETNPIRNRKKGKLFSNAGPVLDAISTGAMSALVDRSGETSFILLFLTLGWVGYGERRHAELPREDVPSRL